MKPSCKHNHLSDLCEICNSSPISKETQQDTDTWSEGGTEYRKREGFIEAKNALNPDWIVVDKYDSTNSSPAALEVIQFYANPDNWVTPSKGFAAQYDPELSPVKADRGEKAREFLRINGLDTPSSASADHVVDMTRLVRLFPSPWSFDTSPQETPPSRYSAVIYSADSTRICETRGENAVALAKLIINAVNHSLSND